MDLPSAICIGILLIGLFRPVGFLIAASLGFAALGSLAVVPPEFTGGTSLVAGSVASLFVVLKVLILPSGIGGLFAAAADRRRLGFLMAFTIVAVTGAIVLPRIFEGAIHVFPLRRTVFFAVTEPVGPTTANLTQAAYLLVSFLIAASYCWLAGRARFVDDFSRAAVIGAVALVMTGLLDISAAIVGMTDALSVFKTASYAFIISAEVQGVRRVVGLMPEASAFGGWATFLFALLMFCRNMFPPAYWWRVVAPLTAACALFAVLSTSSTAYVALGVTVAVFGLDCLRGMLFGDQPERAQMSRELAAVSGIVIFLLFAAMFFEETRDTLFRVFDEMILRKSESSSFIERSLWTSTAFEAWLGTGGLGVGVGSVRTSNFFVNVLASTGFVGGGLFVVFLGKVFLAPLPQDRRLAALIHGAKLTLIPSLVGASLAGTTPDYGGVTGSLFGIVCGGAALAARAKDTRAAPRLLVKLQ